MTAEKKVESIREMFVGLNPNYMTHLELKIRDIIQDKRASSEERIVAKRNSEILSNRYG